MVQIRGTGGAVSQNVRKAEKDRRAATTTTMMTTIVQKPTVKKSESSRLGKVMAMMEQKTLKNEDGQLDINDFDLDENSDDSENSEVENTEFDCPKKQKDKKKVKFEKIPEKMEKIDRLPGLEFQFDPDDHELTYATKVIDKTPFFFEEYQSEYPCFFSQQVGGLDSDVSTLNERLLRYTNEVLATWEPQKLENLPEIVMNEGRETANYTNICINPLQAMRAWGLLANVAQNKTSRDLMKFVGRYTTGSRFETIEQLNEQLLNIHVAAEEDFDGCVRLFTELPHHMHHDTNLRRTINMIYGGKSCRAAIQHHSFATDPDGFYSCYRINEETALSTNHQIRYITPEPSAPNWRSSVIITSAMDCSFYWKTLEKASETFQMRFSDPATDGFQFCTGIYAKASIRQSPDGNIHQLDSWIDGVKLYIIKSNHDPNDKREIKRKNLRSISQSAKWPSRIVNVLIPKSTTSSPISLHQHSKSHGLARVYCSEKSQLSALQQRRRNEKVNFITLFDHYHKTSFEIRAEEPDGQMETEQFDVLEPSKAHQMVDGNEFRKYQKLTENAATSIFTYYEDHLQQNPLSVARPKRNSQAVAGRKEDLIFDEPFYYIMTRGIGSESMILCAGYFNNTIWVKNGEK